MRSVIQLYRFNRLRGDFQPMYEEIKKLGKEPFVMPFWEKVNRAIYGTFLPKPSLNFLHKREIIDTMVVQGDEKWLKKQVGYLNKVVGANLELIAKEDRIGSPLLLKKPLQYTSHNTIHHLYHIYYYLNKTHRKLSEFETIVEWGGGYGNFAKIWWRLTDRKGTYIIIDTAIFSTIQWLYLSSIFGQNTVHLIANKSDVIQKGKINIVPSSLMDSVYISGDLFVSTWGLSESTSEAQDYVKNKKWFGCEGLLIGFQDSVEGLEHASRLGKIAEKSGAKIFDTEYISNNHYAFK